MVGGTERFQRIINTLLHVQMIPIQSMGTALGMTYRIFMLHLDNLVDIQTRNRLVMHQPEMVPTRPHVNAIDVTLQTSFFSTPNTLTFAVLIIQRLITLQFIFYRITIWISLRPGKRQVVVMTPKLPPRLVPELNEDLLIGGRPELWLLLQRQLLARLLILRAVFTHLSAPLIISIYVVKTRTAHCTYPLTH